MRRVKLPRVRPVLARHRAGLIEGLRDLLFLAGAIAIVIAGFLVAIPLGCVLLGAALIATSLVIESPEEPK